MEPNQTPDPIIEVIVEPQDDGTVKETKTTTTVEVVLKPSDEMVQSYRDHIANNNIGIQNNLNEVDVLRADNADYEQRIVDATQ